MTKYRYLHFTPNPYPGAYCGGYRNKIYEKETVTYAIVHPEQPYDDDAMLLRWDSAQQAWTMSFAFMGSSFGKEGRQLRDGNEGSERASLVLLAYFGMESRAEEFKPTELGSMSPDKLGQLAKK